MAQTPAGYDDCARRFSFPAAHRKKITGALDSSQLTSDGGVLLLVQGRARHVPCDQLTGCIADRRDPARVLHTLPDILRARIFSICCRFEGADHLDTLRDDPASAWRLASCQGRVPVWAANRP